MNSTHPFDQGKIIQDSYEHFEFYFHHSYMIKGENIERYYQYLEQNFTAHPEYAFHEQTASRLREFSHEIAENNEDIEEQTVNQRVQEIYTRVFPQIHNEVLKSVFHYLSPVDLARTAQVSKQWHAVSKATKKQTLAQTIEWINTQPLSWRHHYPYSHDYDPSMVGFKSLGHVVNFLRSNPGAGQKIVHLDISSLTVETDEQLQELLQYCPNLQHLEMRYCLKKPDFSPWSFASADPVLPFIRNLSQLQTLDLSGSERFFTAENFSLLADLPSLRELHLNRCQMRSNNGSNIFDELGKFPVLEKLSINHSEASGPILRDPATSFPKLNCLSAGGCKNIKADHVSLLVTEKNMESLDISRNRWVTDDLINTIAEQSPNLQSLNLWSVWDLTAESYERLQTLEKLHSLSLGNADHVNNQLLNLLKLYPNLEHLKLSSCRVLDNESLRLLAEFPKLQTLEFDDCNGKSYFAFDDYGSFSTESSEEPSESVEGEEAETAAWLEKAEESSEIDYDLSSEEVAPWAKALQEESGPEREREIRPASGIALLATLTSLRKLVIKNCNSILPEDIERLKESQKEKGIDCEVLWN